MRLLLLMLLFANVAWFAWANWIATPGPAPGTRSNRELPQLQLAHETGASPTRSTRPVLAPTAEAPPRCVSVGPFEDLAAAARAAATLQERGLQTRQRAEQGAAWTQYWVYVGDLPSAGDETRALRQLERSGIADAHAMPQTADGRRISVGLFSDRARAERRARAVEKLGLRPQIAERSQTGAAYWVDFDLAARDSAIAAEGLLESNEDSARIEIRGCPASIERPTNAAPAPNASQSEDPVRVGMRDAPE